MAKKNWKFKVGLTLIIISAFVFLSLLIVPFLEIDNTAKISITTIIIVVGEITFWSGGLLLGKELFTKYKAYMNPKTWFKKKSQKDDSKTMDKNDQL
ncbi:MAG: transporter suffix domain-containing protein [Bacteroidales bacterium]|nr:transporter suffix domain-containing protein [Bacteroidales bacterium]